MASEETVVHGRELLGLCTTLVELTGAWARFRFSRTSQDVPFAVPQRRLLSIFSSERRQVMFTRVVEIQCKPGKTKELSSLVQEKVIPILRRQTGFVDLVTLSSEHEPNRVIALSFWNSREDADRYQRMEYQKITESMQHLLQQQPTVKTYNVESSTTHKLAAGKAA